MPALFALLLLLCAAPLLQADSIALGSPVPQLTLPDQDGKAVDLGVALAHGWTLVYFYPKADTPGCTTEACRFRDSFAALQAKGIGIFGVSSDPVPVLKKFQTGKNLPFPLLSDADRALANAFGVPAFPGTLIDKRQSFLVKDGVVVWRDLDVDPATVVGRTLDAVEAIK